MKYSPEEKQRMERVVAAFSDYLENGATFDVAYSDRSGFVKLIDDEGKEQYYFYIDNLQDMLRTFFHEMGMDAVSAALKEKPNLTVKEMDYGVLRPQIYPVLEKLAEDKEYAVKLLENDIRMWENSRYLL